MMEYIYRDMMSVARYLPWGLILGFPLGMLLSCLFAGRGRKERRSFAALTAFSVYLTIILVITFWSRESGSRTGVDLELFSTWGINKRNNAYVVENVLLFIPYGYVCCWAFPGIRKFFRCAAVGAVTSLGIESLQLVTGRGYFQIDDILTNLLGTMLGYVFFRLFWGKGGRS